ncbi:UNKNOWN [Stylonychia lemnae]|uniref:Uncharacterized protein n=1 Tax=Stylonychia lemnae TaxID=5949 RepID=A0A078B035_STYLE|nr:UNKNOWN [Stylonychia lemnae]|eukprot:CDW87696.1 UNKNOWN [Stylonychia lemnae]
MSTVLDKNCKVQIDQQFWNLQKLRKDQGDYRLSYETQNGRRDLYFNFCEFPQHVCRDQQRDYGHITKPDDSCIHFTEDNSRSIFKDQFQNTFVDFIDQEDKSLGLSVIYENPKQICEENKPYQLLLNLHCDHTYDYPSIKLDERMAIRDSCLNVINIRTRYGCAGSSFGLMWEFMDTYFVFFGIYLFLTGSYYVLFSLEYYKISAALCFIQTFFLLGLWITFSFIIKQDYSRIQLGWISLPVAILSGGPLSYVLSIKAKQSTDFMISAQGGIALSFLMESLRTEIFPNLEIAFYFKYLIVALLFGVFGGLSIKFPSILMILGICLSGSFQICIVIFSDHLYVIKWQYIFFFTTIILMTAVSYYFQFKYYNKQEQGYEPLENDRSKNRQRDYWANAPRGSKKPLNKGSHV